MYGVDPDLDLSAIVGASATQLCVGPFDLQVTFGSVKFGVASEVVLKRNGDTVSTWRAGEWPNAAFRDILGVAVSGWTVPNSRTVRISLETGLEIDLLDNSDQYESLTIWFDGYAGIVVI